MFQICLSIQVSRIYVAHAIWETRLEYNHIRWKILTFIHSYDLTYPDLLEIIFHETLSSSEFESMGLLMVLSTIEHMSSSIDDDVSYH